MILQNDKRIRIISGHYGVGKSEFASNYAIKLTKSKNRREKIAIVDLDIVNPYFTTRGIKEYLSKYNIEIIGPSSEATNADLPALPRDIESAFYDDSYDVIVDLGGDAAGSKVLGRYSNNLDKIGYDFYYLVNVNRPFSEDFDGVYQYLLDIQNASRLKVTHIVNSTHLLYDTTVDEIKKGDLVCKQLSEKLSIPYRYVVIPNFLMNDNFLDAHKDSFFALDIFDIDITLRPIWLSNDTY